MTDASDPQYLDYAQWGELFFETAVTAERVVSGVNVLSGQPIDVGPMGVGPGKVVKVAAKGSIGEAVGQQVTSSPVSFKVELPVTLEFSINLGVDTHRFDAEIIVPLLLTARARSDLAIELEVTPPRARDVGCKLRAHGVRASITQHAANVEGELKRFIAKYVAREIDKPYVKSARIIDVSGAIDAAMRTLGPKPAKAEDLTQDFPGALEQEILEQGQLLVDEAGLTADTTDGQGDAQ